MSPTVAAKWSKGSGGPAGDEAQNLVPTSYGIRSDAVREGIARTPSADAEGRVRLRNPGIGIYDQLSPTLDTVSPHIVAHPEVAGTLGAQDYRSHTELDGHGAHVVEPLPFGTTQITSALNRSNPQPGDPCHPLAREGHAPAVAISFYPNMGANARSDGAREGVAGTLAGADGGNRQAVAFSCKDYGGDASVELAPTMRAMPHDGSRPNGGGQLAVAFKASHFTRGKDGAPSEIVPPLSADADKGDQDTPVAAVSSGRGYWNESETGATLRSQESPNKADTLLAAPMAVRRLTPRECERLQGFPDDWTAITYRGKPAADGPRYKALGNSMAVNVMRWIGLRIAQAEGAQ